MASQVHKLDSICRLCLSENQAILLPTAKVINSSLTLDDVERCTGVRIDDENVSCAICEVCCEKLQKFTSYRTFCMSNDECFRELCLKLFESKCDAAQPNSPTLEHDYFSSMNDDSGCTNKSVSAEKELANAELQNSSVELNDSVATPEPAEPTRSRKPQAEEPVVTDLPSQDKQKKPRKKYVRRVPAKKPENASKPRSTKKRIRNKLPKKLCPECGKLVANFGHHMLTHTKVQNFACPHCPRKCSRKTILKQHVEAVHLNKTVKTCELCGKEFTHASSHTSHMRTAHNVGEWYDCTICNLKFRHPSSLRKHNNRHHNVESNCACTICGMTFMDKAGLQEHQRVHSNEQPFPCRLCTKRFKSRNARRTHELIHNGVVFPCSYCHKTYSYSSLLNKHVKTMHLPKHDEQSEEN